MGVGRDEDNPQNDARLSALEAAVKALQESAVRSPLDVFAENAREMKAKFDRIDRRLRELSVKQEVSGESVSAHSGRLERLEESLDALNVKDELSAQKLKEALERLSGLEEKIASIDKLKAGISEIREALENNPVSAEEFRFCVRKMGEIEAAFSGFSGKLARQEKDQASTVSSIGDLENRLEYLTVILNRLREIVGKT